MTRPLNPSDLKPRGYFSTDYTVVLATGVTIDDALKPEFWSHINAHTPPKLRRFDRLQVIPEDGESFADLIVLASGKGYAKVLELQRVSLGEMAEPIELQTTEVKWISPAVKFGVVRKSDKTRLKTGFDTRRDAEIAARDYETVTA